jgi:D-alanyl-D-alanine carboxypeptidase
MGLKISPKTGLALALLLLVGSLTLALSLAFCDPSSGTGDSTHGKENDTVTTSLDYEYKIDISAYADAMNTTDEGYLLLANKVFVIGEGHVPDNLTRLDTAYTLNGKEISLSGNASAAATALIKEMRALGYSDIYITSAYRSYEYQMSLYNTYFNQEKAAHPDWSDAQIKEKVLSYSAYPGTSEHQTGLCVDLFVSPAMKELENYGHEGQYPDDVGFAETREFQWLRENAHRFGFILRYPEDKVDVTGYSYESWHYRFVGISAATEIYRSSLTLEEYLGE